MMGKRRSLTKRQKRFFDVVVVASSLLVVLLLLHTGCLRQIQKYNNSKKWDAKKQNMCDAELGPFSHAITVKDNNKCYQSSFAQVWAEGTEPRPQIVS
jgi:hypothetical protein